MCLTANNSNTNTTTTNNNNNNTFRRFQREDSGGTTDHRGDSGLRLNTLTFNFLGLLLKHTFTLKRGTNCAILFFWMLYKSTFCSFSDTCPSNALQRCFISSWIWIHTIFTLQTVFLSVLPPRGQEKPYGRSASCPVPQFFFFYFCFELIGIQAIPVELIHTIELQRVHFLMSRKTFDG